MKQLIDGIWTPNDSDKYEYLLECLNYYENLEGFKFSRHDEGGLHCLVKDADYNRPKAMVDFNLALADTGLMVTSAVEFEMGRGQGSWYLAFRIF